MEKITKTDMSVWKVISEPGDGTRYEYLVVGDGFLFQIIGTGHIKYPDAIYITDVIKFLPEINYESRTLMPGIVSFAKAYDCNPWTMAEVCTHLETIVKSIELEAK